MSQLSETTAILAEQIRQLVPAAADVDLTPEDPLITSGLLDSLTLFRLITAIQRQFGIKIRPQEVVAKNFATLAAIDRLISAKQLEREAQP